MHTAGNREGNHHQRCHGGGGIDWHTRPAKGAKRDKRRQGGKDQDQQRSCDRPQQHADHHKHRHQHGRGQGFAISLAGGGECLADSN